ncbi:MAG TPA: ATP-binding cassette domain-containing protein [bacterium]|nr:ATP-binding cassette domain-containing protein [bacterium]HPN30205.1 ATP-binding cassette domain-containing protein [bacterium]
MIKINNITKKFGNQKVLDNISFEILRGEVVGFLGPNGAGKTTAMRIITTYLKPDEGDVYINGINSAENPNDIKKIIGYLPENVPLYPEMRVKEFLEFRASIKGIEKRNAKRRISDSIEKSNIGDVLNKIIAHLSKGYTQRVGLADALLADPKILILDEPTSGLDPNQRVQTRNLIKNLGAEKTVILSTHILPEVEASCQNVLIINKGKIIARESVGDMDKLTGITGYSYHIILYCGNETGRKTENQNDCVQTHDNPADIIETKLSGFDEKYNYSVLSKEKNMLEIEMIFKNAGEALDKFFSFAVSNNAFIRELTPNKNSLENIFISLTSTVDGD